ncbi:MAG: mechanosensitive ion channel family protein [Clostridia bacterium]|nr:mechanosensitive ion channel family protein [Clostridia bacterium]
MEQFLNKLIGIATDVGLKLLIAIVVLIVGLRLIKWIVKLVCDGKLMEKTDKSLRSFVKSLLGMGLKALLFITVAGILGIPTTSFITILASAGVAVGLALQGALSNFAGGVMILIFKPFKVGDYIQAGGNEGTVTDVTIIYTKLTTADNKLITMPNGSLTNAAVINHTAEDTRRADFAYSVPTTTEIDKVREILLKVANDYDLVIDKPAPAVTVKSHSAAAVDYQLSVWCKTDDYWTVLANVNELVKRAFIENNI